MFRNLLLASVVGAALITSGAQTSFAQARPLPQLNPAMPALQQFGLQVTQVLPGSTAAMQGIEPGDVIVSVNGRPVRSLQDLNLWVGRSGRVALLDVIDWRTGSLNQVAVYPIAGRIGVSVRPVPLGPVGPIVPPVGPINPWNPGNRGMRPLPLPINPWDDGMHPLPLPLPGR